jgi:hypothetical protein
MNIEVDVRLETLRDKLRQAAIHSPSPRTRWAAAAALQQSDADAIVQIVSSLSCTYAPALRRLAAEHWRYSS